METTIIVAIITGVFTIINTVISKKTNKKVAKIEDLQKEINNMREENRKDLLNHTLEYDKTYLVDFLSELENNVQKTDVQKKHAYEVYERYSSNGKNGYVKDKWDECKKNGLL